MTKLICKREKLPQYFIENINIAGIVTFISSMISEEEYIVSWLLNAKFIPKVRHQFESNLTI